jgi:hypothetical protein
MFDRIFGWAKKTTQNSPAINFGRYSDNNKTVEKVAKWTQADDLHKAKQYSESIALFFDYLRDEDADNVVVEEKNGRKEFLFYQGSKIVRGFYTNDQLVAEVTLARMPHPSVPVMRRLLEMNFSLYYSRYALDGDRLCMKFDSDIPSANPNKLYYGFKELATRADKQDDRLVNDFSTLETLDTEHTITIPNEEKEVKYQYLMQWVKETTSLVDSLDADKFSGGIAYLLLGLIYRIDYLIAPEGQLLHELELINGMYFTKEEKPAQEKNRNMLEAFKKFGEKQKEEVFPSLYRSKSTFAIVTPQTTKTIADAVYGANQNMIWYRDNNYPQIARQISEYGIAFCQFSYSLPRPLTDFYHVLMMANYADFFTALGFSEKYFDAAANKFDHEAIITKVNAIQEKWRTKYPRLDFKTQNLKFDNIVNFNHTFTTEIEFLNFDSK